MNDDKDDLTAIFHGVSPRHAPSNDTKARAFSAVSEEWEQLQQRRQRVKKQRYFAMAASFFVILSSVLMWQVTRVTSLPVELVQGEILIDNTTIVGNVKISEGQQLTSLAASRWVINDDIDVRLSQGAKVVWQKATELQLLTGDIYVATHNDATFIVNTSFGTVTDIGTRFLVSTSPNNIEVAVREGKVNLTSKHGITQSEAVKETMSSIIDASKNTVSQHKEASASKRWQWINDVSKGYQSNQPLVLLRQIAQDLGVTLLINNKSLKQSLGSKTITGNFNQLPPLKALDLLAKSAQFDWQLRDDKLVISSL